MTGWAPTFAVSHQAWSSVRAVLFTDRVAVRRLQGCAVESWWIELGVGAGLASRGVPAECTVTVLEGRLSCHVFGNEVELPTGHVALLPPNLSFTIRVAGRSPATCLVSCNARLGDTLPLELA